MELMKLNSGRGIAGEFQLTSIKDVLTIVPFEETWTWCDGNNRNNLFVTAVFCNGDRKELEYSYHYGDANEYTPDIDGDAPTIGEQIANMDVSALIFRRIHKNQNEDEDWEEYLPIEPLDWRKIRRRVEDTLRKTEDREKLFHFAQVLNVKID